MKLGVYDNLQRQRFRDLPHAPLVLYRWVLPIFENGHVGGPVVKALDDWAAEAALKRDTVAKALDTLHRAGLVEYVHGRPGLGRTAGTVRRRTIEEVERCSPRDVWEKYIPPVFDALAKRLTARGVPWYGGVEYPCWKVQITGRIGPTGAPPVGVTKAERMAGFLGAIQPGEVLVDTDLSAAEPTILLHELRRLRLWDAPPMFDPYETLGKVLSCDRKKAKRSFQRMAYSRFQHIISPPSWPKELQDLFAAADAYRCYLWDLWPPEGDAPRYAISLGGRRIVHDGRKRMHRGRLLSWRLQGTVADLSMHVVTRLLDTEGPGGWRFFCQLHDSVIGAMPTPVRWEAGTLFQEEAGRLGLEVEVKEARQGNGALPSV